MTTERMTGVFEMMEPKDAEREIERLRRVEQEQAEKIRALEGKLALVMGERDAAASSASLLKQSQAAQKHVIAELREMLRLANDKMAEQVRQARWEVADEGLARSNTRQWLATVRDANAPKD